MPESFVERFFHQAPLWVLTVVILGGMIAAALLGWWLRKHRTADVSITEEGLQEGYVVSAVMGLLALLIGFTFSLAIDRFETRRERVLLEANAISTAYLRAQLLEEPHRTRISDLLKDYTEIRIELASYDANAIPQALAQRNDRAVVDLWAASTAAFPSIRSYDFSSSFLESINSLTELNASRLQARRAHVPSEIFLVLFLYQLIAAGVIGHVLVGRGGRSTGGLLLLLFGIALILVIDIDRPVDGGIHASQEPMERLRAKFDSWPPGAFDRFATPTPTPNR